MVVEELNQALPEGYEVAGAGVRSGSVVGAGAGAGTDEGSSVGRPGGTISGLPTGGIIGSVSEDLGRTTSPGIWDELFAGGGLFGTGSGVAGREPGSGSATGAGAGGLVSRVAGWEISGAIGGVSVEGSLAA